MRPGAHLIAVLAIAGCAGRGDATIDVAVSIGAPDVSLARVRIIVSASDGPDVETELAPGTYREVVDVPGGDGRIVRGEALDALGAVVAASQTAPVFLGDDALVALQLSATTTIAAKLRNHAPVIDSLVASATTISPSATISLTATAHDSDGDPVAFAWTGPGTFHAPTSASTTWTAPATDGNDKLTLTASDPAGAHAATTITIHVVTMVGNAKVTAEIDSSPQISDVVLASGRLHPGAASHITATAFDPDRDTLAYAWRDDCGATITGAAATVAIALPAASAAITCTLHVDVSDGRGATGSGELVVPVGP